MLSDLLLCLARPGGLEPPTYGLEVILLGFLIALVRAVFGL
jgi:hypothetical protein